MLTIETTTEYTGTSMRIYQFDNSDPENDKDIRFMFLIGDNEFIKGATSYVSHDNDSIFKWANSWEWLTRGILINTFSYKDDL